jgi:hypothetical protein
VTHSGPSRSKCPPCSSSAAYSSSAACSSSSSRDVPQHVVLVGCVVLVVPGVLAGLAVHVVPAVLVVLGGLVGLGGVLRSSCWPCSPVGGPSRVRRARGARLDLKVAVAGAVGVRKNHQQLEQLGGATRRSADAAGAAGAKLGSHLLEGLGEEGKDVGMVVDASEGEQVAPCRSEGATDSMGENAKDLGGVTRGMMTALGLHGKENGSKGHLQRATKVA